MEDVDKTIAQAVADEVILGAVLVAKDKSGNTKLHHLQTKNSSLADISHQAI